MNWVLVILRLLLGIRQPEEDPQLQRVAVRKDGTTCHPDPEGDPWLPVSCWGWLKLRTRWLGLARHGGPGLEPTCARPQRAPA